MKGHGAVVFVVVLGFLVIMPSCGKKAPPRPPDEKAPARIEGLQGEWKNGILRLVGDIVPRGERNSESPGTRGCRIYHVSYPLEDPPCAGCPVEFAGYDEILCETRGDRIVCEFAIEKKRGIHFFEARLIGPKGAIGPPSQRIELTVEDRAL